MIIKAILNNDILKRIEANQIQQLVNKMIPINFKQDTYIIKENDIGDCLYVIEDGMVNIYKENKLITPEPLAPGTLFGELALLYNCRRTATVVAITDMKLWYLQRKDFQMIMKMNIKKIRANIFKFLKL
ncbi:cGMP-dependent protein kinase 1 [Thelohanellus kitauei]|uniref:cGMP-dependent protein kinase 1 n=1 Tax=Thelohanellus kitauei TaxID=669202 RepID=A0A0C2JA31_THEKT|nr:cGMP-dependent protein kinase 1 [Thelohanellus kitauei]